MERELSAETGVHLVELAIADHLRWKQVAAELGLRPPDPLAATALIADYRAGRSPAWLTAHLLGVLRAPIGYAVAREILLAAPGLLAESYAGPAMAKIAGAAAFDDLLGIMRDGPRLKIREGAAYGLHILQRAGTASIMLQAVVDKRIRRHTAAFIIARQADVLETVIEWLGSEDELIEALAIDVGSSLLAENAAPSAELAWAMRRTLDAGRSKMAPSARTRLMKRLTQATRSA